MEPREEGGVELHLGECPPWSPGRLEEDSCTVLEVVLSKDLS